MENNEFNQEKGIYSSSVMPTGESAEKLSTVMTDTAEKIETDAIKKQLKRAKRKGILLGFLISLAVMLVLAGCFVGIMVKLLKSELRLFSPGIKYATGASDIMTKENVDKLNKLYAYIDSNFIFDYSKEEVEVGMYRGLFEALGDEYSVYYTKEEYADMIASYDNQTFCGIGAYLQYDNDNGCTVIVRPMLESPAEKSGLKKGDIILEVDGEDALGMDLDMVVSKVRGPKGEKVHLKIKREDELLDFDIVRDEITEETVSSELLDDNIGYISITTFADQTDEDFSKNLDILLDRGATSIIIDLRSNGGGYVDSATNIADRILGEGKILTMIDKNGNTETIDSDEENKLELPMVVLIDGYSASASEILTGALRDYGVATTVGTTSFGKGIIQDIIQLDDGSGLKITAAEYLTPNGEKIHKIGIEPDVLVEFDGEKYLKDGTDNQLEKAKEVVKAK